MGGAAPKKSKREIKELIRGGRRAERTVPICMRADLLDQVAQIERQIMQLESAQPAGGGSLAGNPKAVELAAQQEQLRAEMLEHSIDFKLRGLPRRKWTALLAEHPPRDDHEEDKLLGVNMDDFMEQLVIRCTFEPELDEEDWQELLGETLTDATYELLCNAAWGVNKRDASLPFLRAASRIHPNSDSG